MEKNDSNLVHVNKKFNIYEKSSVKMFCVVLSMHILQTKCSNILVKHILRHLKTQKETTTPTTVAEGKCSVNCPQITGVFDFILPK